MGGKREKRERQTRIRLSTSELSSRLEKQPCSLLLAAPRCHSKHRWLLLPLPAPSGSPKPRCQPGLRRLRTQPLRPGTPLALLQWSKAFSRQVMEAPVSLGRTGVPWLCATLTYSCVICKKKKKANFPKESPAKLPNVSNLLSAQHFTG